MVNMHHNRCGIAIFSGYNQRAIVAFLRTLTTNSINEYVIFARDDKDQILITEYAKHVLAIRENNILNVELFERYAYQMKQLYGWDRFLIAPSTEGLNRFVLDERGSLENMGYLIPLVDKNLYKIVSDKKSFSEMCRKNDFLLPTEFAMPEEFGRKFVAKPVTYRFNEDNKVYSPILIRNRSEYEEFRKNYPRKAYYYQEFLEGGDCIYLLYYFSKSDIVFSLSQINMVQQENGGSMIMSGVYDKRITICEKFEDLFRRMRFCGFLMIEVRLYKNECYVIEANPRFWGPAQLFVDARYNLFEAFLSDWDFMDRYPDSAKPDKNAFYYWSGGMIKDKQLGRNSMIYTDNKKILDKIPARIAKYDIYHRADTMDIWRLESE